MASFTRTPDGSSTEAAEVSVVETELLWLLVDEVDVSAPFVENTLAVVDETGAIASVPSDAFGPARACTR